jgi:hypothetical protein
MVHGSLSTVTLRLHSTALYCSLLHSTALYALNNTYTALRFLIAQGRPCYDTVNPWTPAIIELRKTALSSALAILRSWVGARGRLGGRVMLHEARSAVSAY